MEQHVKGLSPEQLVQLYAEAILALRKRILFTLSEVTITAILDRVLHESQQEYPLLSELKTSTDGIETSDLLSKLDGHSSAEIIEAFQFLIAELVGVLERLTAGLLNKPLYQELSRLGGRQRPSRGSSDREDK